MTVIITTLITLFVLGLAIQVTVLWLVCKLFQSPVGFGKALLAMLVNIIFNAVVLAGLAYLSVSLNMNLVALFSGMGLSLLVSAIALMVVLRLHPGKAILVAVSWDISVAAIMLALVFFVAKPFLFEAFVVPTGAMADTIHGYHKDITCPSCGLQFAVNASIEAEPQDRVPVVIDGCTCPNCRRAIHLIDSRTRAPSKDVQADDSIEIADPGITGGDRIMVGKGLLAGTEFPQRFDLVTFKYPKDETMNYIKRIVGLPGETLAIHGGDIYRLAADSRTEDAEKARDLFGQGKFTILRKSPDQVLSVMRLVYDNDHQASDLKNEADKRWRPSGKGLRPSEDGKEFQSNPETAQEFITYHHALRGMDGKPTLITDFTGYNSGQSLREGMPLGGTEDGGNWVGDLILECQVSGRGNVVLELVRGGERFQASWNARAGKCELLRIHDGKTESLATQPSTLSEGTHTLRLANVDQRLIVWVDGNLPFGDGIAYDSPKGLLPTWPDLSPARIQADRGYIRVGKIKLFRDIYITPGVGNPSEPDVRIDDLGEPRTWGPLRDLPVRTMFVKPGHYFCIGDNPTASSDSRMWGLVPERLLIGKVWLRYYPFSRAGGLR